MIGPIDPPDGSWKYPIVTGDAWLFNGVDVYDGARVGGTAWLFENTKIFDDAIVFGTDIHIYRSQVYDGAYVLGEARIMDSACWGNVQISGKAQIIGGSSAYENAVIYGSAVLRGTSAWGECRIHEHADLTNCYVEGTAVVTGTYSNRHFDYGYW